MPPAKRRRTEPPPVDTVSDSEPETGRNGAGAASSDSESDSAEDGEADLPAANASNKSFLHASRGEAYLHAVARPSKTSSTRWSASFDEPFTRTEYLSTLAGFDAAQHDALQQLQSQYEARFELWKTELLAGFSLLFHGLGSKIQLLNTFAQTSLTDVGPVVIANAFSSGVAITDILNELERVLHLTRPTASAEAGSDKNQLRAKAIVRYMAQADQRIFILIHNLDAPTFRSSKVKSCLAILAACPTIHLLASVDHVKAMLLFPAALVNAYPSHQPVERGFGFLHHHTPTFQPYTQETLHSGMISSLFPPSIFPSLSANNSSSSAAKMASALAVLASLQTNAKSLFQHLAQTQLGRIPQGASAQDAKTPLAAVKYDELLETCKRSFWANNESQMESLLLEFKDHDIVKSGQTHPAAAGEGAGDADEMDAGANGWLWIDMGKATLEGVLERME